jgi:hypothetical protein
MYPICTIYICVPSFVRAHKYIVKGSKSKVSQENLDKLKYLCLQVTTLSERVHILRIRHPVIFKRDCVRVAGALGVTQWPLMHPGDSHRKKMGPIIIINHQLVNVYFFKHYPVFICRANFHSWWPLGMIPILSGFCMLRMYVTIVSPREY